MEIYERLYDNPLNRDGSFKENKLLGDFEILEVIHEDLYSSKQIATSSGKVYLITEKEVSGVNGGSRFEVKELKSLILR